MIGQTISHYEILEKLGEGGMGVVYKAMDTKLQRAVALKFLPLQQSASEEDKARFIREAQAASTMNHPNICTIYSIEEHEGTSDAGSPAAKQLFIAMEYVDGQTLRDRKQSYSIKQVIDIGSQIADGLAAAHAHGIVHRDIKPENIMIRKDGIVQIMDFGLAKLQQKAGTSRLTKAGSTIGTLGYMSPEQVQGDEVDHRTDIFSLGVVLYELLGGQLPFKGVHETAILYEIVNVDAPPLSSIRPDIDPELDRIILECLDKDRDERYQSAKELSKDLKRFKRESGRQRISRTSMVREAYTPPSTTGEIISRPSGVISPEPVPPAEHRRAAFINRRKMPWLIASISILVAAASIVYVTVFMPVSDRQVIRSFVMAPANTRFNTELGGHLAISPNGQILAFVATDSTGKDQLWVRTLSSLAPLPLPGTDGVSQPFWSPDSRHIGFFANGKLKRIEASGGPALTICDAPQGRGGSWNRDGIIVFAPSNAAGLSKVAAAGGIPVPITTLDSSRQEVNHRWPWFLPDGEHFLYVDQTSNAGQSENDAIFVGSLDSTVHKLVVHAASNMAFASGRLLFLRQENLVAQTFNTSALELEGEAVPIAEQIVYSSLRSKGIFSVSQNGILLYQSGTELAAQLTWFDRQGKSISTVGDKRSLYTASLSSDGKRIAVDSFDPQSKNTDIWLYDLTRGVTTRFTYDQATDVIPVWSPDGKTLIFGSDRKGHNDLYRKNSNGTGTEEVVWESSLNKFATSWSADGNYLSVSTTGDPKTKWDIWILPLTGDRTPMKFLQTEFSEWIGSFSPDARWIVYMSNESGRYEVYVRPFQAEGGKWQISTSGGDSPLWSRDGRKIYFVTGAKFMEVDVSTTGSTFQASTPRTVFELEHGQVDFRDVTADGQRILLNVISGEVSAPATLVTNWDMDAKKR
jgi:eukaryotic-like serine/threonine-protein kinase